MTTVGLIGPPDRPEVQRLAMRLEERGAGAMFLDSGPDPDIRLTATETRALGQELTACRGFYVADLGVRPSLVRRSDGSLDADASRAAGAASRRHLAAWNALLERLAVTSRVVNPPRTHDLHGLKPWEVFVYEQEDLPVPASVATSDPAALRAVPEREGGWIRKGMVGGYSYTEPFDPPPSTREAESALGGGTAFVQERIQGENLRVYVLGGRSIGAAEIISRAGDETDSRRGEIRIRRMPLEEASTRAAVRAARRWGLHFAAVDFMIEARGGRPVLLECNSSPFFLSFEQQTGWDISSRLADFLLGRV